MNLLKTMAWRIRNKDLVTSIWHKVKEESIRNRRVTKGATESIINHLIKDTAASLSLHGKASISGFGRFEISKSSGEIVFNPYEKFLNDIESKCLTDEDDN